jgi:hypothetical protein
MRKLNRPTPIMAGRCRPEQKHSLERAAHAVSDLYLLREPNRVFIRSHAASLHFSTLGPGSGSSPCFL